MVINNICTNHPQYRGKTNRRMTKQELIQQAYGDKYESLKSNISESGYIRRRVTGHGKTNGMEYEKFGFKRENLDILSFTSDGVYSWRPKSLIGIEHNNGWTKIESESDLPEKVTLVKAIYREPDEEGELMFATRIYIGQDSIDPPLLAKMFSHWRIPYVEPKPLY